jgi:RimJ/RimL family protein N-acetyltransferase
VRIKYEKSKVLIKGNKIFLRILKQKDSANAYLKWLKDSRINQYLESRWSAQSLTILKEYIKKMYNSKNDYLMGVFLLKSNQHIGNIKIGKIDYNNKTAEIGFLISAEYSGMGFGTEAVRIAVKFALKKLKLEYIYGQVIEKNFKSSTIFKKNGFKKVGLFKNKAKLISERCNIIYFEKLN